MKDHECRTDLAKLEVRTSNLEDKLNKLENVFSNYEVADLNRRFNAVVKELGFSFDSNGVFDNNVTNTGSLWRLQLQLSALISTLNLEEVWSEGVLSYRPMQK